MKRIPIPHIFKRFWKRSGGDSQVVETRDKTGWGCTVADCSEGSLLSPDRDKIAKAIAAYPKVLAALVNLVQVQFAHDSAGVQQSLTALRAAGLHIPKNWKP